MNHAKLYNVKGAHTVNNQPYASITTPWEDQEIRIVANTEFTAINTACVVAANLNSINLPEKEEQRRGEMLARILNLPLNKKGRYELEGGDKTALGLYRTVKRILIDGDME
jgi:hypothetical protein